MTRSRVILRRVAGAFVATALTAFVGAHAARAAVDSQMLAAGDAAFGYAEALHSQHAEKVLINGLTFDVASSATSDDTDQVLGRFEASCRVLNAGTRDAVRAFRRSSVIGRLIASPGLFDGTIRSGDARGGVVACLDPSGRSGDARSIVSRVRAFLVSGDLEDIGALRFVSAQRNKSGTTYVVVRTNGALPLLRAFPLHGDAPGEDLAGLPRPADAVRRLSARVPGDPGGPALAVYRVVGTASMAALGSYRVMLERAGWSTRSDPSDASRVVAVSGVRSVTVVATHEGQTSDIVVLSL